MTYRRDNFDPNLNNLHNAMEYNSTSGKPQVRVSISEGIEISGTVNIPGIIQVQSSPEDPVDIHIRQVGTSGILDVPYLPIQGSITGTVSIGSNGVVSLSSDTLTALERVTVDQGTNPWIISKNSTANSSDNPINVQFNNSTIGVTGLFWQATQPVSIASMPSTPVTGDFWQATQPVSIASMPSTPVTGDFWQATQPVSLTSLPDSSVTIKNASLAVTGTFWQATQPVSIASMPSTPVTGTFWQATQPVSGSVSISSLPEVEIKNDAGNPIPVSGNVTATITDVITVIAEEDPGELYAFNNHAANANRGWTMDDTMRPIVSFQNGSANAADIIKILEYEIGNNNANQSTIVYEWYEGPLTIAGAAIPAWTTFGVHSQYRVYQDKYSSNQGNTFTVPAGTYLRHSGIIIGKNTSGDEGPANLYGGSSRNMLTLCMRRVDNSTKLDVWFAFTIRELS